jgi:hypothetical protein
MNMSKHTQTKAAFLAECNGDVPVGREWMYDFDRPYIDDETGQQYYELDSEMLNYDTGSRDEPGLHSLETNEQMLILFESLNANIVIVTAGECMLANNRDNIHFKRTYYGPFPTGYGPVGYEYVWDEYH